MPDSVAGGIIRRGPIPNGDGSDAHIGRRMNPSTLGILVNGKRYGRSPNGGSPSQLIREGVESAMQQGGTNAMAIAAKARSYYANKLNQMRRSGGALGVEWNTPTVGPFLSEMKRMGVYKSPIPPRGKASTPKKARSKNPKESKMERAPNLTAKENFESVDKLIKAAIAHAKKQKPTTALGLSAKARSIALRWFQEASTIKSIKKTVRLNQLTMKKFYAAAAEAMGKTPAAKTEGVAKVSGTKKKAAAKKSTAKTEGVAKVSGGTGLVGTFSTKHIQLQTGKKLTLKDLEAMRNQGLLSPSALEQCNMTTPKSVDFLTAEQKSWYDKISNLFKSKVWNKKKFETELAKSDADLPAAVAIPADEVANYRAAANVYLQRWKRKKNPRRKNAMPLGQAILSGEIGEIAKHAAAGFGGYAAASALNYFAAQMGKDKKGLANSISQSLFKDKDPRGAKGDAVLNAGIGAALVVAAVKVDAVKKALGPYREAFLIGVGVRVVRSLLNAMIEDKNTRAVMGLPALAGYEMWTPQMSGYENWTPQLSGGDIGYEMSGYNPFGQPF